MRGPSGTHDTGALVTDPVGTLAPALAACLPRQRWFGAKDRLLAGVEITSMEILCDPWPALVACTVEGPPGKEWNVLVGLRPAEERAPFLDGRPEAEFGLFDTAAGPARGYDALVDPDLGIALLGVVAPHLGHAERVRPLLAEQSNTSLVYDQRWVLKVFRRLHAGPNPEIEVSSALSEAGFDQVLAPLATWAREDHDLGVVQPYLSAASDGWALALTSLRDLFGSFATGWPRAEGRPVYSGQDRTGSGRSDEAERAAAAAAGDFAGESARIGALTADLHLALARAFGSAEGHPREWVEALVGAPEMAELAPGRRGAAIELIGEMKAVAAAGRAIRVHGDYHLGQLMRSDMGWTILDFEGEPSRSLKERRRATSPVRDLAGMLRSLHYAAVVARSEWEDPQAVAAPARAWEARNRQALLLAYLERARGSGLLPGDPASFRSVLRGFELGKAIYEMAYERAHRPDWSVIPEEAIDYLIGNGAPS